MFWGNFLFLQDRALVVIAYCFAYSFYSVKVLLAFKSNSPGISHMFPSTCEDFDPVHNSSTCW